MRITKTLGVGAVVTMLVAAVPSTFVDSAANAQTDPSKLPLLAPEALHYVGGFRLPAETVNGQDYSFGGHPVAFNPARGTLFVGNSKGHVAEVNVPGPVNSADVKAMPFATFVQTFADPTEGRLPEISTIGVSVSGLLVHDNRLYGTASIYYDANNTQRFSHFVRSLQLNQRSFTGWSQVWETNRTGYVAGMMALIPAEWQARLGGAALTGQCCIPIVSRTSNGPAAFAFDPAKIGQPNVSATPLLYYTLEHATLGSWDGSNPTYGAATGVGGVAVIAGTRTALYFGRNGIGPPCYGNGTADKTLDGKNGPDGEKYCFDPTTNSKGSHAYPYRYQVWAYDLNDFAAVKAGKKRPWQVVPYGVWPLTLPTPELSVRLGGVGYDAKNQLVYVSQLGADPDGYSSRAIIHALRIAVPH